MESDISCGCYGIVNINLHVYMSHNLQLEITPLESQINDVFSSSSKISFVDLVIYSTTKQKSAYQIIVHTIFPKNKN